MEDNPDASQNTQKADPSGPYVPSMERIPETTVKGRRRPPSPRCICVGLEGSGYRPLNIHSI
ncbi:hypothetical protein Neosp_008206 [[Neocosmospora] mangrovei]